MSDARIRLLIKFENMVNFECGRVSWLLQFSDGSSLFSESVALSSIKGINALVRNLAAHDSYDQYRFYCKECGYSTIEKHKRFTMSNIGCPRCHDTMQSLKLDEKSYDTKLKVTFGSGTWVLTHPNPVPPKTEPLERPEDTLVYKIIESLQPIEKVCHELGIEVEFV